ncbi:RBM43 protein, partial [Calyptomena viridis]|nr:RBM43 protein [Calyptomena viridis]
QVFSSVTATLDVSLFQDQLVLEDLVEEMKKQSPALSFGALQPNGEVAVQGSFPAIKGLRDFLLLKGKSLAEKDKRKGSKSHQKPRRRLQEDGSTTETGNSGCDGEKQVVVLDTDTYLYMRQLYPWIFPANGNVVVSGVTDGDVTTVFVENAGRAEAAQVLSVKNRIEGRSLKLHHTLRRERVPFKGHSREEKQRYKQVCESLKPLYPHVLVIPYDTHVDFIGFPSEVFEFSKKVMR